METERLDRSLQEIAAGFVLGQTRQKPGRQDQIWIISSTRLLHNPFSKITQ